MELVQWAGAMELVQRGLLAQWYCGWCSTADAVALMQRQWGSAVVL